MLPEEKPSRDEWFVGLAWWLVHDVQIRGVEAKSSGRESISDQVHPQKLDGDQGLGHTQGSSKENTHNLQVLRGEESMHSLYHLVHQVRAKLMNIDKLLSVELRDMCCVID